MNEIQKDLLSLLELENGWNYGEGQKIDEDSILVALAIVESLPSVYVFVEAYPLNNGHVSLRIGLDQKNVIGLIIESEKHIHTYFDDSINIEHGVNIELSHIKEFIAQIIWKMKVVNKCVSLDYYTQNIYQNTKELSSPNPSVLEMTSASENWKKLSPLLKKNARLNPTVHYVGSSMRDIMASTKKQPVYHTPIGYSQNNQYYHQNAS